MTTPRTLAVAVAALLCGAVSATLALQSDYVEGRTAWAIFGPAVGWSFLGTGLYAARRRDEHRIGQLMVLLGFAWFLYTLRTANSALVYTITLFTGGLWGSLFLHIGISFPSGRLRPGRDRALVLAGYVIFPLALVPASMFAGDCRCPGNLLHIADNDTLELLLRIAGALSYVVLFALVLARSVRVWRAADPFARLQLTPVYTFALLTFALVTIAQAGAGDGAWWAAFVSSGMMPFAFLIGLTRSRIKHLMEELQASRARVIEAGDNARRKLERDLHDGAQARLVGLALLLRTARRRADGDAELAAMLDRAQDELRSSLAELRELARGIHPAVLTERGLDAAVQALAARAPVPVTVETSTSGRLPAPVESAAYFVVSEGLANVAKYARASQASVTLRQQNGRVTVEVADDGIGGADASNGSGLRGLADRVAALNGTLTLASPAGGGTHLRAEIPVSPPS
jgi:signal transduction histidine kinase